MLFCVDECSSPSARAWTSGKGQQSTFAAGFKKVEKRTLKMCTSARALNSLLTSDSAVTPRPSHSGCTSRAIPSSSSELWERLSTYARSWNELYDFGLDFGREAEEREWRRESDGGHLREAVE